MWIGPTKEDGVSATKMHLSEDTIGEPPRTQWFEKLMSGIKGHTSKLVCIS